MNERFWSGFGFDSCPDFTGKSVLDLGCGEGSRCFEAADHGASKVVGLDTSDAHFAVGRKRLETNASWAERITFFKGSLDQLPPERFDIIYSEDTFEHVMNMPELLGEIKLRLNPGGRFLVGFGPLYHGPDGDHGWLRNVVPGQIPWGHLLLKRYAFKKLSELHQKKIQQTHNWPYLDLNQHTIHDFATMFRNSGMRVTYFRTNVVRSGRARAFTSFARVPFLAKYFTLNIFAILERV